MNRVADFERVSRDRFAQDFGNTFGCPSAAVRGLYDSIILPSRATAGSAGYDFHLPFDLVLAPGESAVIPTGIRARIIEGWMLMICPRSGLGTRYRLRLDNTIGIIDSDYYNADNEGHIMIKLTNESTEGKILELSQRAAFAQGIFIPYGITFSDSVTDERTGGFGSTGV